MLHILSLILFILISLFNLLGNKFNLIFLRVITKPLLMPSLLLFYIMSSDEQNYLIILALICGFLGDVFIMLKNKLKFFILGLFSFLVGHIMYILAFIQSTSFYSKVPAWYILIIIPYLILGILVMKKILPQVGKLKIPVIIYMLVLIFMSFSSFSRLWDFNGLALWLPIIGSLLFVISDTILAFNAFDYKIKNSGFKIMSTYIFAQFIIVLGFLL